MEIHLPRRIHSLSEFLKELFTITCGILIALSLEGIVEWRHHHNLAEEARANLVTELRANQKELKNEFSDLQKVDKQLGVLLGVIHQLQSNRATPVHSFLNTWTVAELHSTSWDTAVATGAIAYLPYSEVKLYTEVYDLQRQFAALQDRALASSLNVSALGFMLERDTSQLTRAELAQAEQTIGISISNTRAMEQMGDSLGQRYSEILKDLHR